MYLSLELQSVCNLGAWCISIQQLNNQIIASHFHSLLKAVVHAIDNPIGSLSTTFEATQVQELAQSFFILFQQVSFVVKLQSFAPFKLCILIKFLFKLHLIRFVVAVL